jgi:hypothetical protein
MRALRGRGRFLKKKDKKKNKSMDPIFFAFYIADDLISWNKNEKNKKKLKDPYKKFRGEKIDLRCFRAIIYPKIKIFGLHVKFPKKISLEKKIIFFVEFSCKRVKKTFFTV